MSNPETQQAKGSWNQLKGRIKESWGVLSDDDLDRYEGKLEQLAGKIQEKTGESREKIREKLKSFQKDKSEAKRK